MKLPAPMFAVVTATILTYAHGSLAQTLDAVPPVTPTEPNPQIEDLGDGRYRIGSISIDKPARRFTVAATVLRDQPPIEFLVSTRGGYKAYEAVLEADATAFEFNLACILIGLDAANATTMEEVYQGATLDGDRVGITVAWQSGDASYTNPGARLLLYGQPPVPVENDEWVYSGGTMTEDGNYLPDATGTLVGVVHRGESVIEHLPGVGLGDYGSVLINNDLLPAVGEAVQIEITNKTTTGN
jgi:hypothetical protein